VSASIECICEKNLMKKNPKLMLLATVSYNGVYSNPRIMD